MDIKKKLKQNEIVNLVYYCLKEKKRQFDYNNRVRYKGDFINRSVNSQYLCILLAGYKEFLYPAVLGRLKQFAMDKMDICILSSGKYSEKLDHICAENNWSYLWTKCNNIPLIQNAAIFEHPKAKYIFKLDEDIFITEGYFEHMLKAYEHACKSEYTPGVLAPILPINGYGHMRILEKLGLKQIYEEKFEIPKYMAGTLRQIESNPDVAKFFWGENGYVPSIDELNKKFWEDKQEERPCSIKFSIGAILFERSIWEEMGYFKVNKHKIGLGDDEQEICAYCCTQSRPVMVSENIVVGHLSFTLQNQAMKEYFMTHQKLFMNK